MLAHYYTFEHFMDKELDNYIKRFVRNYIHYRDEVSAAVPGKARRTYSAGIPFLPST